MHLFIHGVNRAADEVRFIDNASQTIATVRLLWATPSGAVQLTERGEEHFYKLDSDEQFKDLAVDMAGMVQRCRDLAVAVLPARVSMSVPDSARIDVLMPGQVQGIGVQR